SYTSPRAARIKHETRPIRLAIFASRLRCIFGLMMGEKAGSGGRSASRHASGPGEDHQRSWSSDAARGTPLTGFSIVRADSLEAALEMAKGKNEDVVCRGHRVGDFVRAWLGRAHRRRLHGRPGGVEEP